MHTGARAPAGTTRAPPLKRVRIAFEQQRLATGNRQAIETGTRGVRLAQLTRDIALVRKPILVVFWLGLKQK